MTTDELKQAIRDLNEGIQSKIIDIDLGDLKGIKLNMDHLEIVLIDCNGNKTVPIKLKPNVFSLFCYLCIARSLGKEDWLTKRYEDEDYVVRESDVWLKVNKIINSQSIKIDGGGIAQRIANLSTAVRDRIGYSTQIPTNYLIHRPKQGPMSMGKVNAYALNTSIKREWVEITGSDFQTPKVLAVP